MSRMNSYQPIELAGSTLWLLAEKAVYWPEQQALLIADIHFGKAAAYRRLGRCGRWSGPVQEDFDPRGGTRDHVR